MKLTEKFAELFSYKSNILQYFADMAPIPNALICLILTKFVGLKFKVITFVYGADRNASLSHQLITCSITKKNRVSPNTDTIIWLESYCPNCLDFDSRIIWGLFDLLKIIFEKILYIFSILKIICQLKIFFC